MRWIWAICWSRRAEEGFVHAGIYMKVYILVKIKHGISASIRILSHTPRQPEVHLDTASKSSRTEAPLFHEMEDRGGVKMSLDERLRHSMGSWLLRHFQGLGNNSLGPFSWGGALGVALPQAVIFWPFRPGRGRITGGGHKMNPTQPEAVGRRTAVSAVLANPITCECSRQFAHLTTFSGGQRTARPTTCPGCWFLKIPPARPYAWSSPPCQARTATCPKQPKSSASIFWGWA